MDFLQVWYPNASFLFSNLKLALVVSVGQLTRKGSMVLQKYYCPIFSNLQGLLKCSSQHVIVTKSKSIFNPHSTCAPFSVLN